MTRQQTNSGALDGIRVIDLTRVLGGPYCTQILGDHGADVIKIEPPQGDEVRDWGPPFRDGTASYFVGVNRNKRALALDLTKAEAREVLLRLLEGADVMIHNFKPGTLEKWGLGYADVLSVRFPRLIYCHITGFGSDGPMGGLPGYDAAVQAVSGLMSINGTMESGPLRMGTPIVDLGTGLNATIGASSRCMTGRAREKDRRSTSRCTTAPSHSCIRMRRTTSCRASHHGASATHIRTSRPTTRSRPAPSRSSLPWATIGSSSGSARSSARRICRRIRASVRTPTASSTATHCGSSSNACF